MKRLFFALGLVAVLSLFAAPALATTDPMCDHSSATIQSLHDCVLHAADMGHITNGGVVTALTAQLDSAQAALDRGQPALAISILRAFIATVSAQSGKSIDAMHAGHMVEHATNVIIALGG
jgi:hypothetical protein